LFLLPGSLKVQAQLGTTRCPFYVDPCDSETPLDHHTDILSSTRRLRFGLPSPFLTSFFPSPLPSSLPTYSILSPSFLVLLSLGVVLVLSQRTVLL
jgi:hypothetical protein